MIKTICRDVFFLGQKSEAATKEDLQVGRDLQDTLNANRECCVGMGATGDTKKAGNSVPEWMRIKTFGNFSMMYGEKSLLGRNGVDSQFVLLMQILLHNKTKGVRKEVLEELLFGEREVKNVNHALHSVIYNAKKKFADEGLPEANYIEMKDGIVKWTDEIPVWEDARAFDELCEKLEVEEDKDRKLDMLREAISLYTGEFIPKCAGVIWVAAEARRYQLMFSKCVETATELYRERHAYQNMESLGRYATNVAPFADWEAVTMEAMIGMGRYEEGKKLYEETVERYLDRRGLRPSKKLKELLEELEKRMAYSYEGLDVIQGQLDEPEEPDMKAYMCSYPVFEGIYRQTARMMSRNGQPACIMLCTVIDSKGNPMREGPQLEALSGRLEECICRVIRKSDVVTRYSKGQYLVLLQNITEERCKRIQRRINAEFLTDRQRTGIRYYVKRVLPVKKDEKDF